MDIVVGIIVGLLMLMILVVAHEFGHFIASRRNGVNVLEFGIGFPPRAIAWIKDPKTHKWRKLKKSEWDSAGIMKTVLDEREKAEGKTPKTKPKKAKNTTVTVKSKEKIIADGLVFSLNWLPIGGFCQMDGESAEDEREGTFGKANFWKKTKILFAGVGMNWLVAFIVFTVLAWTGMPQFLTGQFKIDSDTRTEGGGVMVSYVIENSPAEAAGFKKDDKLIKAGDTELIYPSDVSDYNEAHTGEEVVYTVERMRPSDCDCVQEPCNCPEELGEVEIKATLNEEGAEYLLGIGMTSSQVLSYSTWSAPIVGAGLTLQITGETFKGVGQLLWNLITGTGRLFSFDDATRESGQEALNEVKDSVSGPVGIIGVLFPSFTSAGPTNLAFLVALISVSLACMNVLPIPALDGGRWLLIAIYKLRGKKLSKEKEQKIVSRAMFVLLALLLIVTIIDITRFF
ncbi:site-2 protease family protein [Candidatus Saccharibacteria bacterium]|nr:site-2 protease family protein [Candidatus Saccharibacteria bacterium]